MGSPERKAVHCNQHGKTSPAYACSHSLTSLRDGNKRGLIFVNDEDGHYHGWCDECDEFLMSHGEEWNDETEGFASISLLCEACFERLIQMNEPS